MARRTISMRASETERRCVPTSMKPTFASLYSRGPSAFRGRKSSKAHWIFEKEAVAKKKASLRWVKVNDTLYYSGTVGRSIPKMGIWDLGRLGRVEAALG